LPKAHVEAPTRASMLLAGLLLKLGTGGFLRLLGILCFNFDDFLFFISFLGIIMSSLICFFQRDLKSLAAYSSINHISFLLIMLVCLSVVDKWGACIIILSHGFVSTIIFFLIGEFYHFSFTRNIYFFGGIIFSGFSFFYLFIIF
jgi:NADH:ubiquinone oxidoreductase subunit 4 (subunit M)